MPQRSGAGWNVGIVSKQIRKCGNVMTSGGANCSAPRETQTAISNTFSSATHLTRHYDSVDIVAGVKYHINDQQVERFSRQFRYVNDSLQR
jgi:hypothetical protein